MHSPPVPAQSSGPSPLARVLVGIGRASAALSAHATEWYLREDGDVSEPSPVTDVPAFTAQLERAFRTAWAAFCDGTLHRDDEQARARRMLE